MAWGFLSPSILENSTHQTLNESSAARSLLFLGLLADEEEHGGGPWGSVSKELYWAAAQAGRTGGAAFLGCFLQSC